MNSFSSKDRSAILDQMQETHFDVLVIGGGITGAGIALDATSRGLKVGLVEMQDFASGTSGRSTKLIHGGLRYLKQMEFRLVAEVGKEREIIHRNAPHLTNPEKMLLPIVKQGSLGKFSSRLGMWLYEWLAGVKKSERHKILNKSETILAEPLLQKKEDLLGGVLFYEYRTDDARLTLEVLKEAVERGATVLNYSKVTGFSYTDSASTENEKKINGAFVTDQINQQKITVNATCVVNAGGPWVDELDDLESNKKIHKLQITKGVHLVIDQKKIPVSQALYFDAHDKRMLFVIPRDGKIYIGTTDTFYNGDLQNPEVTSEDKNYLLNCVNAFFPENKITFSDIESSWAGLRPLINKPGKGPSEISRKDEIFIYDSGLITIAGGKLTGYRKMAERVVNKVVARIQQKENRNFESCATSKIQLSGGKINQAISFSEFVKTKTAEGVALGLSEKLATELVRRYGSNTDALFKIAIQLHSTESNALPLILRVQTVYAIEHEMCVTPSDLFIRRTSLLYFDVASVTKWKKELIDYMQTILKFDNTQAQGHLNELEKILSSLKVG